QHPRAGAGGGARRRAARATRSPGLRGGKRGRGRVAARRHPRAQAEPVGGVAPALRGPHPARIGGRYRNALLLSASYSLALIAPASSSALAFWISSAALVEPAACRM